MKVIDKIRMFKTRKWRDKVENFICDLINFEGMEISEEFLQDRYCHLLRENGFKRDTE